MNMHSCKQAHVDGPMAQKMRIIILVRWAQILLNFAFRSQSLSLSVTDSLSHKNGAEVKAFGLVSATQKRVTFYNSCVVR